MATTARPHDVEVAGAEGDAIHPTVPSPAIASGSASSRKSPAFADTAVKAVSASAFVGRLKDNAKAAKAGARAAIEVIKNPDSVRSPIQSTVASADDAVLPDLLQVVEDINAPANRPVVRSAKMATVDLSEPGPGQADGGGAPRKAKRASLIAIGMDAMALPQMPRRGSLAAGGSRSAMSARSAEAQEGIELLKRGCPAIKVSQRGKQRPTTFKLAADESALRWKGAGKLGKPRTIFLADVLEVSAGQTTTAFERAQLLRAARARTCSAAAYPPPPPSR